MITIIRTIAGIAIATVAVYLLAGVACSSQTECDMTSAPVWVKTLTR